MMPGVRKDENEQNIYNNKNVIIMNIITNILLLYCNIQYISLVYYLYSSIYFSLSQLQFYFLSFLISSSYTPSTETLYAKYTKQDVVNRSLVGTRGIFRVNQTTVMKCLLLPFQIYFFSLEALSSTNFINKINKNQLKEKKKNFTSILNTYRLNIS